MTTQGPDSGAKPQGDIKAHPLVAEASLLISEENGVLTFSESALATIRRRIAQLSPEERKGALGGLVDLAAHLERDRKSPQAANALLLALASTVGLGQRQP